MADAQVQRFVARQKELGLWERTVLFLVSDHAMDTTLDQVVLAAGRVQRRRVSDSDVLVVQNGSLDMVYLTDRGRPDRDAVLKQLRRRARRRAASTRRSTASPTPPTAGASTRSTRRTPAGGSPGHAPATSSSHTRRAARSTSRTR